MPIDVYPTPAASYAPLPMLMGGWSSMPGTGPARGFDCLQTRYEAPGRVLPNGLRNPWAPYAGETYRPASDAAENMRLSAGSGTLFGLSPPRSHYMDVNPGMGGGDGLGRRRGSVTGSMVSCRTGLSGGSGYSRTAPSVGLGGMRQDDGWDGSVGRVHDGFSPDMSSTAGAIPRIPQSTHWHQAPSDPRNHMRMTPGLMTGLQHPIPPPMAPTSTYFVETRAKSDGRYLQPPSESNPSRPKRIPSIKHQPTQLNSPGNCKECERC